MKKELILVLVFLVLASLIPGSIEMVKKHESDFDQSLEKIISPYKFNLLSWEIKKNLCGQFKFRLTSDDGLAEKNKIDLVKQYFSAASGKKTELKDQVEKIVGEQIETTLKGEGLLNPWGIFRGQVFSPPLRFEIELPPTILVISPREEIEIKRSVYLVPGLDKNIRNKIENKIDRLDVSSLTVEIEGTATYPSMIKDSGSLRRVLQSIAHEWTHHYLFFKPLGFRYALGYVLGPKDYRFITINETVANIVGNEIGDLVYYKYYEKTPLDLLSQEETEEIPEFDFNKEMREIREVVDRLLADGQVVKAENYMRERRDFLEKRGYFIRKLNQAYFAFYGTYADSPTSIDPIGEKLKLLRKQTSSLKEFLKKVETIKSFEDLEKIELKLE